MQGLISMRTTFTVTWTNMMSSDSCIKTESPVLILLDKTGPLYFALSSLFQTDQGQMISANHMIEKMMQKLFDYGISSGVCSTSVRSWLKSVHSNPGRAFKLYYERRWCF